MDEKNRSGWYSWPAIILMLIFFWPVGAYFLIKRISGDTRAAMSAKAAYIKYAGIALIVFAVIGMLGSESDDTLVVGLFIGAGGIVLLRFGNKVKREADDIRKYLSIVVNGYTRKIDEIAAAAGKPYEEAKRDLHSMIDKGYLKNAYIDESERRIVLANDHSVPDYESAENSVEHEDVETHMVVCPNCGANNLVALGSAECEYCGSPLE